MDLAMPSLPQRIQRLNDLARNLWWSWHPEAEALFDAIDPTLWAITQHNPVKLSGKSNRNSLQPWHAIRGSSVAMMPS